MKQAGVLLLLGVVIGYTAGLLRAPSGMSVQDGTSGMPSMPPLYPDPSIPDSPVHWQKSDLQRLYENRLAEARANPSTGRGSAVNPPFQTHLFRTHSIRPPLFRWYLDPPRAGSKSGVLSPHSDADQHQAVSDLTVFSGGMGQVVVDGEIENRVYGSKAGPDGKLIVMPAEFNGQPIRGGHTYDVKAGDWVMIPPDVPHMYLAEPNEGLMYINMKIYLGFTHPGMEYATYSEN